jgi:hypothetical protein
MERAAETWKRLDDLGTAAAALAGAAVFRVPPH